MGKLVAKQICGENFLPKVVQFVLLAVTVFSPAFVGTTLALDSPLMHSAANVNPTDTKGYGATWGASFTCETCHAQGTSNVKLIASIVATPNGNRNVVFTRMTATSNSQNGVFGNDSRTYSGNGAAGSSNICEVCHRKTQFHRYSTNAPNTTHYNNRLCLPCHPHSAGFKGSGHTVPLYATSAGHTGCATGIGCHANSNPAAPYPNSGNPPDCRSCHAKADPTTANIGCGSCHGAAAGTGEPNGTVHPDAVGSHPKHTSLQACTYCHNVGGTGGNADHGKGNRGTNPAVVNLASTLGWSGATSQCSTTTCHANVYGTGSIASPAWGTASGCSACHSAYPIGADGPVTGGHAAHAGNACTNCHNAGTTSSTAPGTAHGNGTVDVVNVNYLGTGGKHAANTGYSSCAAASCHRNGTEVATGTTVLVSTPVWGVASGCDICHGFPPAYTNNSPKKNSHSAGGHSITCDNCHYNTTTNGTTVTTVANHLNSAYNVNPNTSKGIAFTYTYNAGGGSCASVSCHGTAQWGVTVMDCVSCHTSAVNITKGPLAGQSQQRRAIQPEFTQTWSHKESGGRTVVKADCIVCHMEGDKTSGGTTTLHGDGYINLRDADTGAEITNVTWDGGTPGSFVTAAGNASFARFSRNLGVALESDPNFLTVAAIEVNHCLKCHDSDGATNANAQVPTTGTAGRPFGVAVGATSNQSYTVAAGNTTSNVLDVKSSFNTANASYHPVLGKQNNGFAGGTMMKAPWNGTKPGTASTTAYGLLISCWDCHADATDAWGNTTVQTSTVTAHGDNVTLRANFGIAYPNLCTVCHANNYGTGTSGHGTGSAAQSTSSNIGSRHATCNNCHSSGDIYNYRPWRAVDSHGFNVFAQVRSNTTGAAASASTWTSGAKPWAFIRTNNLSGWRPARGTGLTNASNGTCGPNGVSPCSNSHGNYTPGGWY